MDIILIFACVYMVYNNVCSLMEVPFGEWGLVHWVLSLVSLGLAAAAVLSGRRLYLRSKHPPEEPKKESFWSEMNEKDAVDMDDADEGESTEDDVENGADEALQAEEDDEEQTDEEEK